jgi:hypothetical protein
MKSSFVMACSFVIESVQSGSVVLQGMIRDRSRSYRRSRIIIIRGTISRYQSPVSVVVGKPAAFQAVMPPTTFVMPS